MATSDRKKTQMHADLVKAGVLDASETVLAMTTGSIQVTRMGTASKRNGSIVATEKRVVLFTKKLGGHDVQDFSYSMIASIDHKKGLITGNLDIAASGDHTLVSMIPKDEVQEIAGLIRQKVAESRAGHAAPAPPSQPDVMQQLKQLGELKDAGVLNDAEFEEKKAELLKRL